MVKKQSSNIVEDLKSCTLPLVEYVAKIKISVQGIKQWLKEYKEPPAFGVINLSDVNDTIRMYKIKFQKYILFCYTFLGGITKMDKRKKIINIKQELLILKTLNMKVNYSELSRKYGIDRR